MAPKQGGVALFGYDAGRYSKAGFRPSGELCRACSGARRQATPGVRFFALSGYLITGILLDTLGAERYFPYRRKALAPLQAE